MPRTLNASPRPPLRLVVPQDGPDVIEARARRAIENENQRAARLAYENDHDVRRILAIRTSQALQGGRAALLPPERRRHLVRQGQRLGLRPFEANLIISVVQDGARRGESARSDDVQSSLDVIPKPPGSGAWTDPWTWARLWLAAIALGGLLFIALFDWFVAP